MILLVADCQAESSSWVGFSMLNDKKGLIGKILDRIPPVHREWSFMLAQFVCEA